MPALDDSTLALVCVFAFLIVAPLTVCGVFAIVEWIQQRRKTSGGHMECLRHAVRRTQLAPVAERVARHNDGKPV